MALNQLFEFLTGTPLFVIGTWGLTDEEIDDEHLQQLISVLGPLPAGNYVTVPTGVARFPKEMSRPPRKWAEAFYNIVQWTEMPRGGHFGALEEPDLWTDDVRLFGRQFR